MNDPDNERLVASMGFGELARALFDHDPGLLLFSALGLFGGFWVWRQPEGDEP